MKQILIYILLSLTAVAVSAQEYQYVPFPDSNAVWSEVYWKSVFKPDPRWVYNKYALFDEDTIINGENYHKLYHTNASEITKENSTCIGGIREDSLKRVWAFGNLFPFPDKQLRLLYDFSLREGDTLWMNEDFYNCTCSYLSVKKIDTIKIYKSYRKVFYFNESPELTWIEGIGNIQGLFWCTDTWPINGMRNDMVCMHQNDTLLYYYDGSGEYYYDDCEPSFVINSNSSHLMSSNAKVFPNPVLTEELVFENIDCDEIVLLDEAGCQIEIVDVRGQNDYILDISKLTSGLYFYQLKKQGLISTGNKLIIP
jgi:hypothetical protein